MLFSFLCTRIPTSLVMDIFSMVGGRWEDGNILTTVVAAADWKRHFRQRYCRKCGEIRDLYLPIHRAERDPIHAQCYRVGGRARYRAPPTGWHLARAVPWMFLCVERNGGYRSLLSTGFVSYLNHLHWSSIPIASLGTKLYRYPLIRFYCKEPKYLYRWTVFRGAVCFHSFQNRKYYQYVANPTITCLPESLDMDYTSSSFISDLPQSLIPASAPTEKEQQDAKSILLLRYPTALCPPGEGRFW